MNCRSNSSANVGPCIGHTEKSANHFGERLFYRLCSTVPTDFRIKIRFIIMNSKIVAYAQHDLNCNAKKYAWHDFAPKHIGQHSHLRAKLSRNCRCVVCTFGLAW